MDEMKMNIALANEILGYLGSRPYQEVFQLIEKFQGAFRDAQAIQAQPPKLDAEPV
jgi:hypothetical protein